MSAQSLASIDGRARALMLLSQLQVEAELHLKGRREQRRRRGVGGMSLRARTRGRPEEKHIGGLLIYHAARARARPLSLGAFRQSC